MTCYIYETDCTDPWQNLAAEELLLQAVKPGEVILYLWQNHHTVVIGRNQNAWRECNLETLEEEGGKLARRLSGGGAVYHDMGNQNFTFIAQKAEYDLEKQTEVIRLAAHKFGVEAVRSGRNDILVDGRKFSGNAFFHTGDFSYHHGTVLINSDMAKLGRYLNPSPEKLAGKGVASVQARVVNLAELSPQITPANMREALKEAFAEVYKTPVKMLPGDALTPKKLKEFTDKYSSDEWRKGPVLSYTARYSGRLSFGEVEILFQASEGTVTGAKVFTDAMDVGWADVLAKAVQGAKLQNQSLQACFASLEECVPAQVLEEIAVLTAANFS